ncbi:MAG: hypothetical protein NC222_06170 [Staphylococcus sp.]|nr:hypothetical protein [Staphylococcus sp.]
MWTRLLKANQTVYHGSPYKFDNFNLSKIGTGDGNKYGWGIYFTTDTNFSNKYGEGKEYYDGKEITDIYISLYLPELLKGQKQKVMKETKQDWPEVYEFAKNFDINKYERKKGYVYECSIPDDNELLNYELEIEQQPLKNKIQKVIKDYKLKLNTNYGSSLYIALSSKVGSKKDASLILGKYGIPGLTYEENEKNFVIWDVSKIKILNIK